MTDVIRFPARRPPASITYVRIVLERGQPPFAELDTFSGDDGHTVSSRCGALAWALRDLADRLERMATDTWGGTST